MDVTDMYFQMENGLLAMKVKFKDADRLYRFTQQCL